MVLYLLHQAASGFSLFLCHEFESEDTGKISDAVRNCVSDLKEFSKVVKLVAFEPFQSPLHALNQITAFSSGQMTDELHKFLVLGLPKPEEGNDSELSVGLAEPKLGSRIFQDSYHPENNKWIEDPSMSWSFSSLEESCIRKYGYIQSTSKFNSTTNCSPCFSKMTRSIPPRKIFWRPWAINNIILYLVESGVDILLVTRITGTLHENGQQVHATRYFDVFTYNFDDKRWVKVDSLGDRSLFLGGDHSLSLSVLDIQGCQGNSIYFTDHISSISNETGVDTGVFSLEDGSIKKLTWRRQRESNKEQFQFS
ncbi:hypothetical protein ACET3Z_032918 [Daucus carota]